MKKVAFICVHNSCRSQVAEALGKSLAADAFFCYSAGTEAKDRINPDAVRLMKQLYGIDMERDQRPKLLDGDPPRWTWSSRWAATWSARICPRSTARIGGFPTRSGQCDEVFLSVIQTIEKKVWELRAHLLLWADEPS